MATHSSILYWKIPWAEKPGGLQFMGPQGVGHNQRLNNNDNNQISAKHFRYIILKGSQNKPIKIYHHSVQFSNSVVSDSLWPHEPQHTRLPCLSQLPELTQTHVHRVSDAIQPSHPLSSPSPPALNLSQHQGLSNESVLHIRWPKYWSFIFSISLPNEYSGLISSKVDWSDLLAVQGTLKSLLQHHNSKASILRCSPFFIIKLSLPYTTTRKTIALTRQDLCWQSNVSAF